MAALNECQPESRFAIAIELHRTDCGWPRACIELYAETRIYGSHEYDMLLYATALHARTRTSLMLLGT